MRCAHNWITTGIWPYLDILVKKEGDESQGLPVDEEARNIWLRFLPSLASSTPTRRTSGRWARRGHVVRAWKSTLTELEAAMQGTW
jgi:hypothetical protein